MNSVACVFLPLAEWLLGQASVGQQLMKNQKKAHGQAPMHVLPLHRKRVSCTGATLKPTASHMNFFVYIKQSSNAFDKDLIAMQLPDNAPFEQYVCRMWKPGWRPETCPGSCAMRLWPFFATLGLGRQVGGICIDEMMQSDCNACRMLLDSNTLGIDLGKHVITASAVSSQLDEPILELVRASVFWVHPPHFAGSAAECLMVLLLLSEKKAGKLQD